jgi:hypothetical protein
MKKKIFQIFLVGLLVFSFTSFGLAKDKVIEWKVQGFPGRLECSWHANVAERRRGFKIVAGDL